MELFTMSVAELRDLEVRIGSEIKKRQHDEMADARARILAIAQNVGVPLNELINSSLTKKTKATVAVQFRLKDDPTKQWTGRGRQPNWIKEWVAAGKSLDDIRV